MNKHMNHPSGDLEMNTLKRSSVAALGLALLAAVAACEPATDINRVGPNVVDKNIFQGEWYARGTVVDKQAHNSMLFIGYQEDLERIRWEVTEGLLIGYRSYERSPGSEPSDPGNQNIVASFIIQKHFDISRSYNPVNGAESNVIEENDYDKPWYERQYVRVDWSRNLAPTWTFGGIWSVLGPSVTHNADDDPTYPWRVRVSDDYIETTLDVILEPDDYGCYYLDGASACQGADAKYKFSFMKVDPTNDYEPLNYVDYETMQFGNLVEDVDGEAGDFILSADAQAARICLPDEMGPDGTATFKTAFADVSGRKRVCRDDESGCADTTVRCDDVQPIRVADGPTGYEFCDYRFHDPDDCFDFTIPGQSKFGFFRTDRYVNDRENNFTLTGRERLVNRHNIWKKSRGDNGAPLPYAERETKPIVYYVNPEFPEDLMPAAEEIANDWDNAFRDTVASLQGKSMSEVERIFEVRRNNCSVANVNEYASQHGLEGALSDAGIDLDDVGLGNLQNACAVLEHASNRRADIPADQKFTWQQMGDLRYNFMNWTKKLDLAGPLGYGPSSADPVTGEIISATANIYGSGLDTYANWGADIVDLLNGRLTTDDIINGTHVREHVQAVRARWSQRMDKETIDGFMKLVDDRTAHMLDDEQYFVPVPTTAVNANLDAMRETGFEQAAVVNADMIRLFGGREAAEAMKSGGVPPAEALEFAAPSSWARTKLPAFMVQGAPSWDGQLDDVDTKKAYAKDRMSEVDRYDQMVDYLTSKNFCYMADQTEPAIAALAESLVDKSREEVVKQIRHSVFRAVMAHEVGHTVGLRHNFEGSGDAMNFFPEFWDVDLGDNDHREGATPRKEEAAYSSIMDYHQRFNSDFAGIGLYDKAAIKFGYGRLVEVFDESDGGFVPRGWMNSSFLFDPNDLPYLLSGDGVDAKLDAQFDEVYAAVLGGDENITMDPSVDADGQPIAYRAENLFKRRNINYLDWKLSEVQRVFGQTNDNGVEPDWAVPYNFCSDAYAWGGNLTCNRYDMGVTSEEIVRNAGQMYEFYYPFNAFRGDRATFTAGGYMNRLYTRTYQPMLNAFRYFYYYRRSTAKIWPMVRDWSTAAFMGMNFFARVVQTPEVGRYCLEGDQYVPEGEATGSCDMNFMLGIDQGKFYNTKYTDEFDYRLINVGAFYDKALAIQAMTDTNAFFFRDFSNFVNRSAFSIGYYRVFQPEMLQLFGGLLSGDSSAYSSKITVVDGKPVLSATPFVQVGTAAVTGTRIKPADSYFLRTWSLQYAMANLSSTFDQTLDFSKRARITLTGSSTDPSYNLPADQLVTFTDPVSLQQYSAAAVDGVDLSIGFKLLRDAQSFTNDGTDGEPVGEWAAAKADFEAKRAALEDDTDGGDPTTEQAQFNDAARRFGKADADLNDKLQIIDWMRILGDWYEYNGLG